MPDEVLGLIDDRARELARENIEGRLSDENVRREFADLIFRTRVAQDVARTRRVETATQWDEIEAAVSEVLTMKAYAAAEDGGLDISRIAQGASLSGWARQLGKRVASSKHRDLRTLDSKVLPFDPSGTFETPSPFEHLSVAAPNAERCYQHLVDEFALEALELQEAVARDDADKVRARARALRLQYQLPAAVINQDLLRIYRAREALESDSEAAIRSLRTRGTRRAHGLLSPMWVEYDDDSVETVEMLTERWGDQVAHLLLNERLVAESRPPMNSVRLFKSHVADWSVATGWQSASSRLIDAYLSVACTPLCRGDRRNDDAVVNELLNERKQLALTWPKIVTEHLAAFPKSPIGTSMQDVSSNLATLLDAVLDNPRQFVGRRRKTDSDSRRAA